MAFKDSSLTYRMLRIRDRIWGKFLPTIAEGTGIDVGLLRLVERNQRKRLTEEQYQTIEKYLDEQGL